MAKKKKAVSAPGRKQWKAKTWDLFSRYIRIRDAINTTGNPFSAVCVTCDNTYPLSSLQAGHFIPGRGNGILFDERGVHAQCRMCNVFDHGRWVEYERFMQKTYGAKVVDELKRLKNTPVQRNVLDYLKLFDRFYDELQLIAPNDEKVAVLKRWRDKHEG